MRCRYYVGPLEHRVVSGRIAMSGDYMHECVCGNQYYEWALLDPDVPHDEIERRIAARAARRLKTGNANFSIVRAEPSDSQTRLLRLLKMTVPDTYIWAARMLKKAGYRKNGIPRGTNWQGARKLADEQLLKAAKR